MLNKEESITIFWIFDMTRLEIEPQSPGPLANTLPTMLVSSIHSYLIVITCVYLYCFKYFYQILIICKMIWFQQFLYNTDDFQIYLTPIDGTLTSTMTLNQSMAMKGWLQWVSELEPHHQMQVCVIPTTTIFVLTGDAISIFYALLTGQ